MGRPPFERFFPTILMHRLESTAYVHAVDPSIPAFGTRSTCLLTSTWLLLRFLVRLDGGDSKVPVATPMQGNGFWPGAILGNPVSDTSKVDRMSSTISKELDERLHVKQGGSAMPRKALLTLLALCFTSLSAHAQIVSWCRVCVCDECGYSTTGGDVTFIGPNDYPDGGDCGCTRVENQCTTFGICKTYTTDPNSSTDCPTGLNAKCCDTPYSCGGHCTTYSGSTTSAGSITAATDMTLLAPDSRPVYVNPSLPPPVVQTPDGKDLVRINPADFPWLTSATFVATVSAVSGDVGLVLKAKKRTLELKVGWNIASRVVQDGGFVGPDGGHIRYQIQRNGNLWKFWVAREQRPGQQIWQVPSAEWQILTINGRSWKLTQDMNTLGSGTF